MNDGWKWDIDDSFYITNTATVSWTAPFYEMAEPYELYQCLIINGIVMDGKNGRDYIVRKTDGIGSPDITWKFCCYEPAKDENGNIRPGIYELIEKKYVDGKVAYDKNGKEITRHPTGEYGKTYFVVNGNMIEYWIIDDAGKYPCRIPVDPFDNTPVEFENTHDYTFPIVPIDPAKSYYSGSEAFPYAGSAFAEEINKLK